MKNKLTVLMPVYNGQKYLPEAIDSILNQTYKDFEFLIIDDASTDKSVETILSYTDPRIKLVRNEKNLGLIGTLNKGLELATGEYIARMDQDDISKSERLKTQIDFLENSPKSGFVTSTVMMIDENSNPIGHWDDDKRTISYSQIKKVLLTTNCIAHPAIMGRAETYKAYKYDEGQISIEDYDLWLRLVNDGNIISKLDEDLLLYRRHSDSITQKQSRTNPRVGLLRCKFIYLRNQMVRGRLTIYNSRLSLYLVLDIILVIMFSLRTKIYLSYRSLHK